jgi:glycosyltransferase involved in cell wall biosynthesis
MIFNILLIALTIVIVIQIIYYLFIFGSFSFGKNTKNPSNKVPVSVIVCAKNEAENIKEFFPLLIEQNYPEFEIVLIDDASSDDTLDLFEEYEKQYPNVKLVKVENNETFWGNKKYALTLGIKASKHEHLLFIDADCKPTSNEWISIMTSNFTKEKSIVLGYGAYDKVKNSLLNKIIRFETLMTAVQYFSWAKIGSPYMGVGRNLAYKKEEFYKVNGFIDHMKIRSGDDDLFINQASTKSNTTICFDSNSFTYSKPNTSFKNWLNQKRRHVSTASYYKGFDKFQLGLFYTSQLLFILLSILLLALQFQLIIVSILIITRYLISWISLGYSAGKLNEKDVMYFYPFIEIILIFTQINLFVANLFSKPKHWK